MEVGLSGCNINDNLTSCLRWESIVRFLLSYIARDSLEIMTAFKWTLNDKASIFIAPVGPKHKLAAIYGADEEWGFDEALRVDEECWAGKW